ncbi:unnamed protein product [Acanthoscelides obtectus]|nr:unnamed protein product [Acanthoscelides obtectus]CAK1663848.1 hypothetical protein AOBTE_LOCUS23894 [Acanthoscelides obtectus]
MNQLLCCLRYYASAGHIRQTAYFMGMHASTACRIVGRVLRTILTYSQVMSKFNYLIVTQDIEMPTIQNHNVNTAQE